MPHVLDGRPLLVRLNARIQKYSGCTTEPLAVDIALHQQSVEELGRLATENGRLRKHIDGYRQIRNVPLLGNYSPYRELVQSDFDDHITALRSKGMSIDGDNAYKRDLCDSIIGALAFGKQNADPPPAGHWGQVFWDIGRAEGQQKEELIQALRGLLIIAPEQTPEEFNYTSAARAAVANATHEHHQSRPIEGAGR